MQSLRMREIVSRELEKTRANMELALRASRMSFLKYAVTAKASARLRPVLRSWVTNRAKSR
jgi:hypothetical protein